MDETPFSLHLEELSAEDLAVIQAFDALDDLELSGNVDEQTGIAGNSAPLAPLDGTLGIEDPEDMLILFASEADEDIGTMRRALQQLEQDYQTTSHGLVTLGRSAHKLKGTAGAMGCEAMSAIALQIEEEIQLIKDERIEFLTGLMALVHAINALEMTLQSVVNDGQESTLPLQELLQDLTLLNADAGKGTGPVEEKESTILHISPKETPELSAATATAQVDIRYLNALMSHTEHLIELHIPLQSAQKQVTKSLMELQAAYARLRRLEGLFPNLAFTNTRPVEQNRQAASQPSSSLVGRILQEARQRASRQGHGKQRLSSPPPTTSPARSPELALWDEMEMDRFTENKILLQSLNEAVADVATASAQLRAAFAQLNTLIEQQVRQATVVRNDALRLRSAPFSVLLTRVQRAVQMIAQAQEQPIQFEAGGETTEIDQDILEFLAGPLLHLVRTSVADSLLSAPQSPIPQRNHIWLKAQTVGNEIVIELGFSMPIPGGALEALRSPIQQLHGSIAAQRNSAGGVSYQLRFPRTQGMIQGLLVQAGGQGLVLPLPQIHSIDYKRQEPYAQAYNLASLLGFSPTSTNVINTPSPIILLTSSHRRAGLQVDEVVGEIELVMKPLATHLQRPGVVGTAIDGAGNVLLVLDLHSLIQYDIVQRRNHPQRIVPFSQPTQTSSSESRPSPTVLVADDSVYMRQSLRHTFEHAGYQVIEARDGIEALEYFTSDQIPPDILMLDIEMPNLNGYDLLNILHSQPGLSECKTILLTSRSSEKHRLRAMELGAYAFLSKPCPQEVLLDTVHKALTNTPISI
jgi:chemosensory pili system protein ChpA (sensor histidine kinase/response regulator)